MSRGPLEVLSLRRRTSLGSTRLASLPPPNIFSPTPFYSNEPTILSGPSLHLPRISLPRTTTNRSQKSVPVVSVQTTRSYLHVVTTGTTFLHHHTNRLPSPTKRPFPDSRIRPATPPSPDIITLLARQSPLLWTPCTINSLYDFLKPGRRIIREVASVEGEGRGERGGRRYFIVVFRTHPTPIRSSPQPSSHRHRSPSSATYSSHLRRALRRPPSTFLRRRLRLAVLGVTFIAVSSLSFV